MSILQTLTAVVTSVDIGAPVDSGKTQFGNGRNAILFLPTAILTSTVLVQTAPVNPNTKAVPAEDSDLWTTVATLTSADPAMQEVTGLQRFLRWNTTVLDADGPNVAIHLIGVT